MSSPRGVIPVVENDGYEKLYQRIRRLVFCRVRHVRIEGTTTEHRVYMGSNAEPQIYNAGMLPECIIKMKPQQRDSILENYSNRFMVITDPPLRETGSEYYDHMSILGTSENLCEFDPFTFSFKRGASSHSDNKLKLVPFETSLVVGHVERNSRTGKPYFVNWAQASDQLLRCVSVLLNGDEHCMFFNIRETQPDGSLEEPRRALMRGNRLMLNNSLVKEQLARNCQGAPPLTDEEIYNRFDGDTFKRGKYTRYHGESVTRDERCVHWYCAVVTLVLYRELPCEWNIPNNIKGYKLTKWILPENEFSQFQEYMGTRVVGEKHVSIQEPPSPVQTMEIENDHNIVRAMQLGIDQTEAELIFSVKQWGDDDNDVDS